MGDSNDVSAQGWPPPSGFRRVIIPDMHGDWQGLWLLLRTAGVVDENGQKTPKTHVTFLGDIAHLGHDVFGGDVLTLRMAEKYGDLFILGNHEAPLAFGFEPFDGALADHMVHPEAKSIVRRWAFEGRWQAAAAIDGWLITHAGLHWRWQRDRLSEFMGSADSLARQINRLFYQRVQSHNYDPLFDSIGPIRGGGYPPIKCDKCGTREPYPYPKKCPRCGEVEGWHITKTAPAPGGVLWMDSHELSVKVARNRVRQIAGHTARPEGRPRLLGGTYWIVDVGKDTGMAAALVKEEEEEEWTPLVVRVRSHNQFCPRSQSPEELLAMNSELANALDGLEV